MRQISITRRRFGYLGAVVALVTLGGCQSLDTQFAAYDRSYVLHPGDRLVLETPILFPRDHARVKMQADGVIGTSAVDEYYPYCELEVGTVSDGKYTLQPDTFTVRKFDQRQLPWNLVSQPVQVAALDLAGLNLAQASIGGSHSQITYVSDIWLHSDAQPDVLKLSCRHVVEPQDARYVTVAEMQEAVQGVIRIERISP